MLKLKLQYFGHLMRRVDSLEKTDAGRDWGQEDKPLCCVLNIPRGASMGFSRQEYWVAISFST